ncbi:hypothetical protein B0H12DRAFT_1121074 [Mycena haematopus]|nr:hypothetical protein B0H12DRAFT_1156937 [Mycena haematopus]KAJ7250179.1 hypothetical protein B0H12DRAFT_1121074 [Mycena haematopus]
MDSPFKVNQIVASHWSPARFSLFSSVLESVPPLNFLLSTRNLLSFLLLFNITGQVDCQDASSFKDRSSSSLRYSYFKMLVAFSTGRL